MSWSKEQIETLVGKQRTYFRTGATLDVDFRILQLKRLKTAMQIYEEEIKEALAEDLGRDNAEGYFCDIGTVILETNEMIKGIRKWAKPETHFSGLVCFPSVTTKVHKMPYGTALIISPFNFPFTL